MRVLVCGGRDFTDREFVFFVLNALNAKKHIGMIIHGCARGADTFGEEWSAQNDRCTSYGVPADWKKYGNRAGPVRNRQMIEWGKPDLVVAFDGGAGTQDMVNAAVAAGIRVIHAEKLRRHYEQERSDV